MITKPSYRRIDRFSQVLLLLCQKIGLARIHLQELVHVLMIGLSIPDLLVHTLSWHEKKKQSTTQM